MALTKVSAAVLANNSVTANSIGYTPANKAGDTFTGDVTLTTSTAPNLVIQSSNTSLNQNLWFRSNGTNTFGIEAQSNTGGSGAYLSNRTAGGNINFRTTPTGGSLQTSMYIDGSGRVRMPYQPAFKAYLSTNGNTSVADNAVLPFDLTVYNIGGHYNTSTYRFTAPVSGLYAFQFFAYKNGSGSPSALAMRLNGGGLARTRVADTSDVVVSIVVSVYLSTNDYIDIVNTSGITFVAYDNTTASYSCFMGYLIG